MTVWWVSCGYAAVPPGDAWLTAAEREIAAGLAIDRRRRDWRLGRWTAKQLLASIDSGLSEVEVLAATDGAPEAFAAGEPLGVSISISHRESRAACAASDRGVVGCDLERIEPRSRRFVADFFTETEADAVYRLAAADRPLACAVIWSAKEAALKVRRTGLRRDTRGVEVDIGDLVSGAGWRAIAVADRVAPEPRLGGWRRTLGELVVVVVSAPPQPAPLELSSPR